MIRTVLFVGCILLATLIGLQGSGVVPAVVPAAVPATNKVGNSSAFQLAGAGSPASGICAAYDASANIVPASAPCPQNTTTANVGAVWLPGIVYPVTQPSALAIANTANRIYALQVVLPWTTNVSHIMGNLTGGGSAASVMDFGLYVGGYGAAQSLVVNTNGVQSVTPGTFTTAPAQGAGVSIKENVYWFTWCSSSTTTVSMSAVSGSTQGTLLNIDASHLKIGSLGNTTCTAGVLPPSADFSALVGPSGPVPPHIILVP